MALNTPQRPALPKRASSGDPPGATGLLVAAAANPMAFALALFLLAALVIGWPWLSGRVTIPWDAKAHFQPQIQFLAQSLARGESPAWAPFVFSGHPQIADPQAMIFSPPFLALALIDGAPSLWAMDATVLAMVFLGGAALMLWFRDQGWHWVGGLIAALAFSYGASMAWRIQHTGQVLSLAYLPVAMLCLDRALARGSILYGVAAGLVAACIVLGRDQVALLGIYFLAGLAVWRLSTAAEPRAALRASALPLAAGGVCAALLIAIPVLLTALLAQESNRASIDYIGAARGSLHPALLLTLVMPDVFGASGRMEDYWGPPSFAWPDTGLFIAQNMGVLYIGALPLLLLVTAAVRGQLWAHEIRFFTCAAGVALAYALGWYTPAFRVFYALLPGVDLYRRPADATFLVGALAAILAGYGAHRLLGEPRTDAARQSAIVAGATLGLAFLLAIGLGLWLGRMPRLSLPLMTALASFVAAAAALAWAMPRLATNPLMAVVVLAGVTTVDLAYNNGPSSSTAQPPAMYDVLEPDTRNATIAILKSTVVADDTRRDRIELAGLGFHWPNASLTHALENTLGYNPLRLALYSQATGAGDHVGLPDQRQFSPLFPSYRSTLANLLGLRFIVTGAPIESMDRAPEGGRPAAAGSHHRRLHLRERRCISARSVRDQDPRRRLRAHAGRRSVARRRPTHDRASRASASGGCGYPPQTRQREHRQLPQHRSDPESRQPRRRLPRPQRPLAPLVARRGRRPAGSRPPRQRPLPRGGGAGGDARGSIPVPPDRRSLGATPQAVDPRERYVPERSFSPPFTRRRITRS